jgi:hypothetical protein
MMDCIAPSRGFMTTDPEPPLACPLLEGSVDEREVVATFAKRDAHDGTALMGDHMFVRTTPKLHQRRGGTSMPVMLVLACVPTVYAGGPDVNFDFARSIEYRDVTPPARAERYPHERLLEVRLPISVRFTGLAGGEVEHLDVEIDGSTAGLRVAGFSPTTELAAEATKVETTTRTLTSRSLDGTIGGAVPLPVGALVAHVAPSVSAGAVKTNESTEKVHRLPPMQPLVVSGTFGEGRGVFFKFKRSTQTSFEGVHDLMVTFVAPSEFGGGSVRIACTARGHRPVLWLDQPTVFGRVVDTIDVYPEGDTSAAAARRAEKIPNTTDGSFCGWASFVEEAGAGIKRTATSLATFEF